MGMHFAAAQDEVYIKKQASTPLAFGKSKGSLRSHPNHMTSKAYSFTAKSTITILTEAQLDDLVSERCKRGCSDEELEKFRNWHLAKLRND